MKKADYQFLLELLQENAGWNFGETEYFMVDKKISGFVREKGYSTVEDLIAELRLGSRALVEQVVEALALSDTYFFRDYQVFRRFEDYLLPALREANRGSKKLRIWSLGCSTGQEAYSIAMAVNRKLVGINDWEVRIIANDLSSQSIAKAQKGLYSMFEVQMGLTAAMIIDNFTLVKDMWQINPGIQKMVDFRRYNILDEVTAPHRFEVVFCRNLLRFFTPEYQHLLLEKIYHKQINGGFLYLGIDEKLFGIEDFYQPVKGFACLYQAKKAATDPRPIPAVPLSSDHQNMPSFQKPDSLRDNHPLIGDLLKNK